MNKFADNHRLGTQPLLGVVFACLFILSLISIIATLGGDDGDFNGTALCFALPLCYTTYRIYRKLKSR